MHLHRTGQHRYGCADAARVYPGSPAPHGQCFACAEGKYALPSASCSPAHSCSGTGRSACDPCDALECQPGKLLAGCGGNSSGACVPCPANTFATTRAHRTACRRCGAVSDKDAVSARCGVGQVLQGCGLASPGRCLACGPDEFSTSDGTLAGLQYRCSACADLRCAAGEFRFGCGTAYDDPATAQVFDTIQAVSM